MPVSPRNRSYSSKVAVSLRLIRVRAASTRRWAEAMTAGKILFNAAA